MVSIREKEFTDKTYIDLLKIVLEKGTLKENRTKTPTLSISGLSARYKIYPEFPLLVTKKVNFNFVVRELLWFLSGSTNANDLGPAKKIWEAWAKEDGSLGPVYGQNWRKFGQNDNFDGVDQISNVIESIKNNPQSRRHIVSAWDPVTIEQAALPPCHSFFQFIVRDNNLDCILYQRSADLPIGVPFNIASYSLLTMMIAQECGLVAGDFIHMMGDAHIYLNQVDGVKEQINRLTNYLSNSPVYPTIRLGNKKVLEMEFNDIELMNYNHMGYIKMPVAV